MEKIKDLFRGFMNFLDVVFDFFTPDFGKCPGCLSNDCKAIGTIPDARAIPSLDSMYINHSLLFMRKMKCNNCGEEWIE